MLSSAVSSGVQVGSGNLLPGAKTGATCTAETLTARKMVICPYGYGKSSTSVVKLAARAPFTYAEDGNKWPLICYAEAVERHGVLLHVLSRHNPVVENGILSVMSLEGWHLLNPVTSCSRPPR